VPPAACATILTALAVGAGWAADAFGLLSAAEGAFAAIVVAGGLLTWAVAHSFSDRRERDAARRTHRAVLAAVDAGKADIHRLLEQARTGGNRPEDTFLPGTPGPPVDPADDVAAAVRSAFAEAARAVVETAALTHRQLNTQAELAEITASIVPRLQGLVTRGIDAISRTEGEVEDPDLLGQLFGVDHLLTQMRREVESLLVLGGNLPSRNSPPVLIVTAIRRAIGEIPDFARVRVGPNPVTDAVPGYVSPNLVHLLAALMENATRFSTGQVEVYTHRTDDGIAVEILDRGTGMSQAKREALNRLLTDPESADPRARLREGTIGLLVAALLARRHRISVMLRPNVLGGTQAIVVLPRTLLTTAVPEAHTPQAHVPGPRPGPQPAQITRASAAGLPRRVPQALALQPASPDTNGKGGRPDLPRREPGQPPRAPAPPAPAGRPTGSLMARFQSRTPSDVPTDPDASAGGLPAAASDLTQE
jgi:signal transduction histidine kinase